MNSIATFFRESRIARFFIPAGIMLIIFGVLVFIINSKNQNYIETQATISKVEISQEAYTDADGNYVDATYDISVKYTVGGKDYEQVLGELPKYNIGDKMKIYYNPKDPSQITQTKSLILPIAIIVSGATSLVGGTISAFNAVKKHKALKTQEEGWENGK